MLLFSINIDNLTLESFKCLTVVKLIEILKSHDEPIAGSMDVLVTEQDSLEINLLLRNENVM